MPIWSEQDIETLRTLAAAGISVQRISVRLKRRVTAVQRMAEDKKIPLKGKTEVRRQHGLSGKFGDYSQV